MNEDLDHEIQGLPRVDLPPLTARALFVAAQRRLAHPEHPSWLARQENSLLLALSAAHLTWAVLHVWKP